MFKLILSHAFSRIILLLFFVIFFMGSLLSGYLSGFAGLSNSYDLKRILVIVFVMVTMVLLSWRKSVSIVMLSRYTCWVASTIFIVGLISALNGKHPFWSLLELANFILMICLFFIIGSIIADIGKFEVLRYFFWFSLFFSLCTSLKFFLLLLFHFLDTNRPDVHSLISGFMNVRFFNQLQVMLMPLLCLSFYIDELKKFKWLGMLAFSFLWLILLQSEARGALLAIILSVLAVHYFLPVQARKHFTYSILIAIVLGSALWLLLIVLLPLFFFDSEIWQLRTGSSGRVAMWIYILQEIPQRILIGYGPMSFAWAEAKPLPNAHPHNALLQFLYEYGVVIFLLVASWSVIKLTSMLRELKQAEIFNANVAVVFALCSAWIYSMFDGMTVMPLSQALLAALLALNCRDKKVIELSISRRIVAVAVVLVFGGILVSSLAKPELNEQMYPRLWLQGLIKN